MKDRIKRIMDQANLTPAKFADKLQINRAIISHILNGRNNPSLDVVTRILGEMNYINPEWLLSGEGNMYKPGFSREPSSGEPDLFHQDSVNPEEQSTEEKKPRENTLNPPDYPSQLTDTKNVEPKFLPRKEITQIIIYYTDNTFEVFRP